jgi:hypothetical protein
MIENSKRIFSVRRTLLVSIKKELVHVAFLISMAPDRRATGKPM